MYLRVPPDRWDELSCLLNRGPGVGDELSGRAVNVEPILRVVLSYLVLMSMSANQKDTTEGCR